MSALLVAIPVLPALAAVVCAVTGPRWHEQAGRLALGATAGAFALSVAVLVEVVSSGPVAAVIREGGGATVLGLFVDRLAGVLLVLVCGVGALVQAFGRRYLRGDPRAGRFFAATLVGLAAGWTLAGLGFMPLLGLYRELAPAREGMRRTARAFAIGDGALWIAVIVATTTWGDLDLRVLGERAGGLVAANPAEVTLVACLLVVAALSRCAQLPLQRWLPATLAAPTPVSALLHAGVVNAGGFLLARMSPLFGASSLATHLAFAAGALTALYGTALMLVKPDVKGALAHSTMGQMGFMIMTCGLGAFAAAIFHLVAHGMYKAALFLGSGAAVHRHLRHTKAPPAPRGGGLGRAALALAVPGLALAGAVALVRPGLGAPAGAVGLLGFAWASGAQAAWGWLGRRSSARAVLAAVGGLVAAALGYVALVTAAEVFLAPALHGAGDATASPLWLAAVAVAFGLAMAIRSGLPAGRLGVVTDGVYVAALDAGHVVERAARRRRAEPAFAGRTVGGLRPCPEGSSS